MQIQKELVNAGKLLRLKLRDARKGILVVLLVVASLVTINAAFVIRGFLANSSPLVSQHFMDYSALVLVLAPLIVAFVFWQEFSGSNSIYPQTSTSRFLSVQALSLLLVFLALCVVLVLYLVIAAVSLLIGILLPSTSNFILGYGFSPVYLATGFFAALAFLIMVTTIIAFVTFAVRAFKLFAVVPIVAMPAFYLFFPASYSYQPTGLDWLRMQLEFFLSRFFDSLTTGTFLLTCLSVTCALLVAGIVLKRFMSADKGHAQGAWMLAIAYAPYVMLTLLIGTSLYVGFGPPLAPGSADEVLPNAPITVTIDAADLPADSRVYVVERSFNRDTLKHAEHAWFGLALYTDGPFVGPWGGGGGRPFAGQSIVLDYTPATFEFSSAALQDLTRPDLSARLDGDRLYLEHTYGGEGNVLFMPIWSMLSHIQENQLDMNPETELREE